MKNYLAIREKLKQEVFTAADAEWRTLEAKYAVDSAFLEQILRGEGDEPLLLNMGTDVLKKLFIAKKETTPSRITKLRELVAFAKTNEIRSPTQIHPLFLHPDPAHEFVLETNLNIENVRWLVTARQKLISGRRADSARKKLSVPLSDWLKNKELPPGEWAYVYVDSASGEKKASFDVAWPKGLGMDAGQPVAIILDPSEEISAIAREAGYRCFTSLPKFKSFAAAEILRVKATGQSVKGKQNKARSKKAFRVATVTPG